ncbi:MAG: diaminopimelate epimerase [Chloroflexota bacterium]
MDFTKIHGAGNDFILIEPDKRRNWSKLAVAICDRHFGIGGDGLLLVMPSKRADVTMRIFNADGSEAEACGNGLRCVVKYAVENRLANPKAKEILIETIVGIRRAEIKTRSGKLTGVRIGMGKPFFAAEKIPVSLKGNASLLDIKTMLSYSVKVANSELRLYFVSMGNPHAVYFTGKPVKDFSLAEVGSLIEHHAMFPKRTNFEVARVLNRTEIEERTWERGVGETLACGTGIAAVAVAARLLGYTDSQVAVKASGGTLNVGWDGMGEVMLGGPVEIVFSGKWQD